MKEIDLGDDPLALDRQVCFALSVASRAVIGVYRPLLEPLGLTHPQYLVMLALWDRSPRSVRDLGRTLHAEPATLSPMLKRLEAVGYLSRQRNRADERELLVQLTDAGTRLREEAEKIPYRVVDILGADVAELQQLHTALNWIIAAASPAEPPAESD
ncbi:DNA-binding MarR family transcriptional regulator [Actinoalloteichus hoggarensis]|uniref:Organic hydroperoxide resistance transcriptional regulator n=1 Tax=Actinoalloteichus hoggarensis TaxID=1470176 RepID=A0A221W3U3_9PSEU|nr:MarR family transcriptional regulator [Actinoalloteichus hoggarensis]ASO20356.1 Organic hydroperoxide resistance transcriptional regulator [Actinoalloteichus hoggarensis]MBB5923394.1 DNA-binding MarR family transcriptional regulator [Actinoalloteichus hoggarensis]